MPGGVGPWDGSAPPARPQPEPPAGTQRAGEGPTATYLIRRNALLAALDRDAWLTLIVAGPGTGKTQLLSAWAATRPVAWLALGPEHAALAVLRRDLATALAAFGLPAAVLDPLADDSAPGQAADDESHAAGLASVVSAALDRSRAGEVPVILDGAHHLPSGSASARFVEELCRHAPAGLRLIIAGRTDLPFPVDRLRSAGRLAQLRDADLSFADFETYRLLTVVLGDAAAADTLAAQLHTLAGGRPSLVALGAAWLASQPAAQRRDRLGALNNTTSTANALAEYLAWELLNRAEPAARELVRRAAYLPRVSAQLCAGLDTLPDVDPVLAVPLLAPVPGAPGWYAPAGGVRRAVVARTPLPVAEREALLAEAAGWYAEHGRLDDALGTAAAAHSPDPIVALLAAHGAALLAAGRADEVAKAAARVPAQRRTKQLDLVEGEARHLRGDARGALACLERLAGGDGALSAGVAHRIATIHRLAGDIEAAWRSLRRARLDGADATDKALLHAQIATVHWDRGELADCREAAERALSAARAGGGDRALAAAHSVLALAAEQAGDMAGNAEHMAQAMAAARRAGDLNQQIRLRVNASGRLLEAGRHADALVELDEAMRLIETTGAMDRYAVVRTNRGWAYRGMGRLDEAVAELEAAARVWRDAGSGLLSYALTGLGSVYLVRGDLAQAETALTEAAEIGERTGDHQALAGLSTLNRVRYATDPPSAWRITHRAIETGVGVWRAWALLSAGWLALHDGDLAAARRYAAEAAEVGRQRSDAAAQAEVLELTGWLTDDPLEAQAAMREAGTRWARMGNPIFVARAAAGLAARTGGDFSAAETRLRALGVRPEAGQAAGPLRAAGAFATVTARPFIPTARAGLARFARGDLGQAQTLLADALDDVRGDPGRGGVELRSTYLDALRALASASAAASELDVALRWYLRLLEHDPDDESGHLGVVIMLARSGRHDEARRRYRGYTDRMRAIGAEPAPYPSEWTLT